MYARSSPFNPFAARPGHAGRKRVTSWLLALGCVAYLLVLAAWSAPAQLSDEAPPQPEHGIKAAFLYRFLSYVEWRPRTFARPTSPVVIGVLGAEDIAAALQDIVRGRTAAERPVAVQRVTAGDPLDGVHMLFVGRAQSARVARLAAAAQRRGVLLVTDYEGALEDGSAINFVLIENRVRFEVSLDATQKAGLKLSSRMLAVALWVRPAS